MERAAIPSRQAAICQRLRLWREKQGITRVSLATTIAVKPDSYSMYEHGRAPVRYGLAHKILSAFSINAKWLATGEGPDSVDVPVPSAHHLGVSPRELFSVVYDTHLAADVERKTAEIIDSLTVRPGSLPFLDKPPMSGQERALLEEGFFELIAEYFWRFPDDQLQHFVNRALSAGQQMEQSFPALPHDVVISRKAELEKARAFIASRRKELGIKGA